MRKSVEHENLERELKATQDGWQVTRARLVEAMAEAARWEGLYHGAVFDHAKDMSLWSGARQVDDEPLREINDGLWGPDNPDPLKLLGDSEPPAPELHYADDELPHVEAMLLLSGALDRVVEKLDRIGSALWSSVER